MQDGNTNLHKALSLAVEVKRVIEQGDSLISFFEEFTSFCNLSKRSVICKNSLMVNLISPFLCLRSIFLNSSCENSTKQMVFLVIFVTFYTFQLSFTAENCIKPSF